MDILLRIFSLALWGNRKIRNQYLLFPYSLPEPPKYFLQRHAEAHYRMASPWLGLALTMLSAALILKGQIRRDLWSKRVMANVSACVLVIICVVMTRGWTSNQAALWPSIHFSILIPIGFGRKSKPTKKRLRKRHIISSTNRTCL